MTRKRLYSCRAGLRPDGVLLELTRNTVVAERRHADHCCAQPRRIEPESHRARRACRPTAASTDSRRPTLSFNASTGRFSTLSGVAYELEASDAASTDCLLARQTCRAQSHTLEADLTYADNYTWRVRARVGTDVGPWSGFARFPHARSAGAAATSRLRRRRPAAVPGSRCLRRPGDGDRFACAAAVAALSVEWQGCAAGAASAAIASPVRSSTRCPSPTRTGR